MNRLPTEVLELIVCVQYVCQHLNIDPEGLRADHRAARELEKALGKVQAMRIKERDERAAEWRRQRERSIAPGEWAD